MTKEQKLETMRAMIQAERGCVLEYGTEMDVLSDYHLGKYLYVCPGTAVKYRMLIGIPTAIRRLKAYLAERDAK